MIVVPSLPKVWDDFGSLQIALQNTPHALYGRGSENIRFQVSFTRSYRRAYMWENEFPIIKVKDYF